MNTKLQKKLAEYFEEVTLVKDDDLGLVVSYAKTHWPEVKKTLSTMLQTTLLAQGVVGLFKLNKIKVLNHLSKAGIIYANIVVIKEQHKEGLKNYRKQLLETCQDNFYTNLSEDEKSDVLMQSRYLAGIYHDRDSKDGLRKFREIMKLWGEVFHGEQENKEKFLQLVDYLLEYHEERTQGMYEF